MITCLTFDEARKSAACWKCGDSAALCCYCGESASLHDRIEKNGETAIACEIYTEVCFEDGIGEFCSPAYYVVDYEKPSSDCPGGIQSEPLCGNCSDKHKYAEVEL